MRGLRAPFVMPSPSVASPGRDVLHHEVAASAASSLGELFRLGARDGRSREPFPLPVLSDLADPSKLPSSKKSLRRLRARLSLNRRLAEMTKGVNQLAAGLPGRSMSGLQRPEALVIAQVRDAPMASQREALHILREVLRHDSPASLPAPEEALGELLKSGGGLYGSPGRGAVCDYFRSGPSLPSGGCRSMPLLDLVPDAWREVLTPERMLRPAEEAARCLEERDSAVF